jgi:chemotaxis protein methyltransferase WspC
MKPIENRLRETIGLDIASVGPGLIQRAVRQRMRSQGLKRIEDYRPVLAQSDAEWQELVEAVVITETWFFRDPEPIAAFVRQVREEWLPAHPAIPLRLLCVPCASGEEPFSLVMALLDAGVPAERFHIDAADISARALARANRGVYGKNSFRGQELAFRDRYFQPCKSGYTLDPAIRDGVRFWQGNFLDKDFLSGQAAYDFIFCRNLLIYLDPVMRRKALAKIDRLLAPAGVLFVGPVEQPLALDHGFVTASILMAFACRKVGPGVSHPRAAWLSKGPEVARPPQIQAGAELSPPASGQPSPSLSTDLETASRLADAGRLKEAADICEAHLRGNQGCAQAHYLLGVVRESSGEPGAIDCYRKALYLEPNHYESLLHMALLLHRNGDMARARAFKSRAQRVRLRT